MVIIIIRQDMIYEQIEFWPSLAGSHNMPSWVVNAWDPHVSQPSRIATIKTHLATEAAVVQKLSAQAISNFDCVVISATWDVVCALMCTHRRVFVFNSRHSSFLSSARCSLNCISLHAAYFQPFSATNTFNRLHPTSNLNLNSLHTYLNN